jgi:hypothetical protein
MAATLALGQVHADAGSTRERGSEPGAIGLASRLRRQCLEAVQYGCGAQLQKVGQLATQGD